MRKGNGNAGKLSSSGKNKGPFSSTQLHTIQAYIAIGITAEKPISD